MSETLTHWQGSEVPDGRVLEGAYARLERLDAKQHGGDLWAAVAHHDALWDHMAYGPFAGEAAFATWLSNRASLADPFYYAVIDRASGRALGALSLMEIRPGMGVIEIGHIFFSPDLQRTPAATEAIFLSARHAFADLGYRRLEWKCDNGNSASKRAAERYGFLFEGVFRQHMVVKGRNRDTAWFSIINAEWPLVDRAFTRWLASDNFDPRGNQALALSAMTARNTEVGSLKLTRANPADHDDIRAFQEMAYARHAEISDVKPLPLKWDYANIFTETEVWQVKDKGDLVGVLILRPRDQDLYLESIATLPRVQGGGYGNAMLDATEFRARDWGYDAIRLVTGESLTQNVEWYLRKGFKVEDVDREAERSVVDMVKHLRP